MMVDLSKIEIGDTVDVRGYVTHTHIHRANGASRAVIVGFAGPDMGRGQQVSEVEVSVATITAHIPKPAPPLVVNDRVRSVYLDAGVGLAVIRAIIDEHAWIRWDDDSQGVEALSDLERIP